MPTLQPRLHPDVTLDMAIVDKTYSLVDIQLVAEEAFEIDAALCIRLIATHMPARDTMDAAKMANMRVTKDFLRMLDRHAPVLWLNAVSGVYRSRLAYDSLSM